MEREKVASLVGEVVKLIDSGNLTLKEIDSLEKAIKGQTSKLADAVRKAWGNLREGK